MVSETQPSAVAFRGARLVDPARGIDDLGDLFIQNGRIVERAPAGAAEFDASGPDSLPRAG